MLRLLQQQQVIDRELYDMLSARPLGVQPRGGVISPQPAFMQMVRQELQSKLGDKVKRSLRREDLYHLRLRGAGCGRKSGG